MGKVMPRVRTRDRICRYLNPVVKYLYLIFFSILLKSVPVAPDSSNHNNHMVDSLQGGSVVVDMDTGTDKGLSCIQAGEAVVVERQPTGRNDYIFKKTTTINQYIFKYEEETIDYTPMGGAAAVRVQH